MRLKCPHCYRDGDHSRSDFFGDWVVCPACELPFPWREARDDEEEASARSNGRQELEHQTPRTEVER